MAVTTRDDVPTKAPSWKVVIMTSLTVLVPIALNHLTDLSDGEIAAVSGLVTFIGGWLASPQGMA